MRGQWERTAPVYAPVTHPFPHNALARSRKRSQARVEWKANFFNFAQYPGWNSKNREESSERYRYRVQVHGLFLGGGSSTKKTVVSGGVLGGVFRWGIGLEVGRGILEEKRRTLKLKVLFKNHPDNPGIFCPKKCDELKKRRFLVLKLKNTKKH